ncbi:MAG: RidA family protein [Steroidobacteraceae bacterium]
MTQTPLLIPRFHGHEILVPEGWPKPKGYANAILASGRLLVLGGQIGWDESGALATGMTAQIKQALLNIARLLAEADSGPEALVRLTWYVTDIEEYSRNLKEIGAAYRSVLGYFYPAMTLVQITRLGDPTALVEIEATAVIPG